MRTCDYINFPVALDKTEWGATTVVFLGMLLNGKTHTLSIDETRHHEILNLVRLFTDKKKATVKQLQKLAGHLNFVSRAIVPGLCFYMTHICKIQWKQI